MSSDNKGPSTRAIAPANGVLEDTYRVVLPACRIRTSVEPVRVATDDIDVLLYRDASINWSAVSARRLMNGNRVPVLLWPDAVLLRGEHRPAYSVIPGMDKVAIATITKCSEDLDYLKVFELLLPFIF